MTAYASDSVPMSAVKAVQTRTIEYEHHGTTLKGFVAYDAALEGERPGVLVFPEWWGVNEYAKTRARQLAELGYVAFAADVNGEGRVIDIAHPEEAASMAATLRANTNIWRGRAEAALSQLTRLPNVDASKVAAIGYCLDTAFQLAYTGADLKAIATFHSFLPKPTEDEARAIAGTVLVCLGGADKFISESMIKDFRTALDSAGVKLDIVTYEGVLHSFTSPNADKVGNPSMRYDRNADVDSWRRMKELFDAVFEPLKSMAHRQSNVDDFGAFNHATVPQ